MKRFFLAMIGTAAIVIIVPLLIVEIMGGLIDNSDGDKGLVKVYFADADTVKEINREDYLVGVVAAEMAADFDEEALKAQAVAARTYMEYHIGKAKEHKDGAVVCTDYTHCQAWTDIDEKMESWGNDAKKYRRKIENAVRNTADEMIHYNGELINAVFFSTSSGNTENAEDVWGEDFRYLVSVPSEGEENAPNFTSESVFSTDEVKSKITEQVEGVDFSNGLFGNEVRSEAGGIKTIEVGGVQIKGTLLRSIFALKSTNIQIQEEDGSVIFKVRGNGHGVGMSQYGAEAMAENGADYKEILTHYYTGCEVAK